MLVVSVLFATSGHVISDTTEFVKRNDHAENDVTSIQSDDGGVVFRAEQRCHC